MSMSFDEAALYGSAWSPAADQRLLLNRCRELHDSFVGVCQALDLLQRDLDRQRQAIVAALATSEEMLRLLGHGPAAPPGPSTR